MHVVTIYDTLHPVGLLMIQCDSTLSRKLMPVGY